MSICSDRLIQLMLTPRRIRQPECTAFADQNRWVNFTYCLNLTPSPDDNDPATAQGAWTVGDLPVTYAWQDVADNGDDLLFVAIANRVYVLDATRHRDEWNWGYFKPIYRKLTIGPIPGNRDEQEEGVYQLAQLKRFRRFTFQLASDPTDEGTQYKVSVGEEGANPTAAAFSYRTTQRHGNAQIATRGYSFLVTLEHEANEDFPLLWWQAEWEALGDRRANDPIVAT